MKESVTMEALRDVQPTPPEGAGEFWRPIPHHRLLESLGNKLDGQGVFAQSHTITLSHDGADMAASLLIRDPTHEFPEGMTPSIALTSSNAQRFVTRAHLGLILEDGVGVPLYELPLQHARHTVKLTVESLAGDIAHQYRRFAPRLGKEVWRLREKRVNYHRLCLVLCKAGNLGLLPWSRIGRVEKAFNDTDGGSAWDVLTAFCAVVRMGPALPGNNHGQAGQVRQAYLFKCLVGGGRQP